MSLTEEKTVGADECGCGDRGGCLDAEHHDWLLSFEERGVAGVVELLHHFSDDNNGLADPDTLSAVDFPDFVSRHNWQSPANVRDLAVFIGQAISDFRRVHNAETTLGAIETVVRTYRDCPTLATWAPDERAAQ